MGRALWREGLLFKLEGHGRHLARPAHDQGDGRRPQPGQTQPWCARQFFEPKPRRSLARSYSPANQRPHTPLPHMAGGPPEARSHAQTSR
ncbi:hypothetical protein C8Q78DRAFT_1031334 [Trametes maxima]|nr:hypothetical protein C8Q78DRAFT_1031334 [Trametes maxima]